MCERYILELPILTSQILIFNVHDMVICLPIPPLSS
jgi:hypothetical protein